MPRRRSCRRVCFNPRVRSFKPQGVPLRNLETVVLSIEELEAIRLKNLENLDQNSCAAQMETSQSTFQRILSSAYQKISEGLVNGKAIQIQDKEN